MTNPDDRDRDGEQQLTYEQYDQIIDEVRRPLVNLDCWDDLPQDVRDQFGDFLSWIDNLGNRVPDEERIFTDGGEHTCENCGESSWTDENGKFAGIVCSECGYRPRKAVRDEIRENGEALATDGGEAKETAVGQSDTFIAEIEDLDDVNDATRRVTEFLDELCEWNERTEVRIVVVEVDDAE